MKKIYHIYPRGVRRGNLFETPSQHLLFRRLVCRYALELGVEVLLLVTMTNHYHIIIECSPELKPVFMKKVNWAYARSYNETHDFEGHAFERSCKGREITGAGSLIYTARYGFLNPVVAGMVLAPGDYPYSTYLATIGRAELPEGIRPERILRCFSDNLGTAREKLKSYVEVLTPEHPIVREAFLRVGDDHPRSAKAKKCRWILEFTALTAAALRCDLAGVGPLEGLGLDRSDLQLIGIQQITGASGSMIAKVLGLPKSSINKSLARIKAELGWSAEAQTKFERFLESLIFQKSRAETV